MLRTQHINVFLRLIYKDKELISRWFDGHEHVFCDYKMKTMPPSPVVKSHIKAQRNFATIVES